MILKASRLRVTIFLSAWHSIEVDIYRRNQMSEACKYSFNFYGWGTYHPALPSHCLQLWGVGEMMSQKEIGCCYEWFMEIWRQEATEVNYIVRNFSCSSKLENIDRSKHCKENTRKMLLHGRIFKILFGLPNQFIVTLLTSNTDGNLSIK